MNGAGIPLNTPTQIPELRTIIGETNHGIDSMKDLITVDTTHNLIKIKEREYKGANGKLVFTRDVDGTLSNERGNIFILHPIHRFRAPIKGDIVYLADKSTGEILKTKYTVIAAAASCLMLDRTLESYDKSKYTLCYSTSELLDSATESPEDPTLLIKYSPITNFSTDVFIDSEFIFGLEMRALNRLTLS